MSHKISALLDELKNSFTGETVNAGELLEHFEERGFGVFIFLFALPCALPVPAVGYGTIMGIPLVILSAQMIWGCRSPHFPRWITQKQLKTENLNTIIRAAMPYIIKIEVLFGARLTFLTSHLARRITGLLCMLIAAFVCLPLPLTNTVPSFALAIIGAGIIMRDGLAVIAGTLIGFIWIGLLSYFLITLGAEGAEALKDLIKGLIQ